MVYIIELKDDNKPPAPVKDKDSNTVTNKEESLRDPEVYNKLGRYYTLVYLVQSFIFIFTFIKFLVLVPRRLETQVIAMHGLDALLFFVPIFIYTVTFLAYLFTMGAGNAKPVDHLKKRVKYLKLSQYTLMAVFFSAVILSSHIGDYYHILDGASVISYCMLYFARWEQKDRSLIGSIIYKVALLAAIYLMVRGNMAGVFVLGLFTTVVYEAYSRTKRSIARNCVGDKYDITGIMAYNCIVGACLLFIKREQLARALYARPNIANALRGILGCFSLRVIETV